MHLSELNKFSNIIIQCHDNPDADSIASAFALMKYFESIGKNVRIIYGGNFFISKCNIELMISELGIKISHVDSLDNIETQNLVLLTVDCQYGEGNVTKFKSDNIAIIDHHKDTHKGYELTEIRSNLGSCSTLVWSMLRDENYDVNLDKKVATALYYGLFMDTGGLAEIVHPTDRDFMDSVYPDKITINKLKNTNLSLQELETAGIALIRHLCDKKNRFALVRAHPCDPNILGIISDLLLQVKDIDICIVYNELPFGYKLSVRSCRMDVKANEFAEYITSDIGNGGGHSDKAGGFISREKFESKYGNRGMDEYLMDIQKKYFDSYDILNGEMNISKLNEFQKYVKNNITLGYVVSSDIINPGSMMILRTMEGDVNICASKDIYIMIDIDRNVYPIERNVFENKYTITNKKFISNYEYVPKVKDVISGEIIELPMYSKECIPKGKSYVYAKKLVRPLKVFTKWNYDNYMYGKEGDYLVFGENNPEDRYIVKREIMEKTYKKEK